MASGNGSGNGSGSELLVVGSTGGITVIDPSTPLKRLNYFDGKFLRAADLDIEQSYLRRLVAISNQGLGPGVVYGYDTVLGSGDNIQIGPGLAIDPSGNVLLLQKAVSRGIQELIDASKKAAARLPDASGKAGADAFSDCVEVVAPPPTAVVRVSDIYVIAICAAEALCGQEDVYGQLCAEACVTSTDRPYRLDGVVLRAIPLQLVTPFPTSKAVAIDSEIYLRSKVAHSWFADELAKHPNAISRDGLLSKSWCLGAGYDSSCCEVPLAVVARSGSTTVFLDAWTVRRERMEAPSRRYWQWKMLMRPWDVFLAQVLQFQCQLAEMFAGLRAPAADPCRSQNEALGEAARFIEQVRGGMARFAELAKRDAIEQRPPLLEISFSQIAGLQDRIQSVLKAAVTPSRSSDRILIDGGIIELPPAGYLPVMNRTSVTVNDQVRALLGPGLDLRFCIVTADYVAHALEEAQHMDRISLLQGIDDPANKPRVDILVPDGHAVTSAVSPDATLYRASGKFAVEQPFGLALGDFVLTGAAREQTLSKSGTVHYLAGIGRSKELQNFSQLIKLLAGAAGVPLDTKDVEFSAEGEKAGFWVTGYTQQRIRDLRVGAQSRIGLQFIMAVPSPAPASLEWEVGGALTVTDTSGGTIKASLDLTMTIGLTNARPVQQQEFDRTLIRKLKLAATFSYTGDDLNGSLAMDIFNPAHPDPKNPSRPMLRITRTFNSASGEVDYFLIQSSNDANNQTVFTKCFEVDLSADSGVADPDNHYRQLAEEGLDLLQAAILESAPSFRQTAQRELFPLLPPSTAEVTVDAVHDWVLFHKRREETCALEETPIPQKPPRTYRVFNVTASQDEVEGLIKRLHRAATDPAFLTRSLQELQNQKPELVIKFAATSSQPLFDPVAAEADWKTFKAGDTIVAVAYGCSGDNDPVLQTSRLKRFEEVISADSKEKADGSTVELPIVPFQASTGLSGADGMMLFVTVSQAEVQHVYATKDAAFFKEIVRIAETDNFADLSLGRLADLGKASSTGSGSSLVVSDQAVVTAFREKFGAAAMVAESIMISHQGDPEEALNNRTAMAEKIVKDLGEADAPGIMKTPGTLPVTDAHSMLVILVLASVAAPTNTQPQRIRKRKSGGQG